MEKAAKNWDKKIFNNQIIRILMFSYQFLKD